VNKLAGFQFVRAYDAKELDTFTPSVGDALFMSPQLLAGEPYTEKTDVWSFGAIFYFILYGTSTLSSLLPAPWTGSTPADVLKHIQSDKLVFPKSGLRQDYVNLMTGCLQVEEEKRFTWEQVYKHRLWGGKFAKVPLFN
jgi:serine/threonine protein kinase